jgi:hypothetical protein
MSVDNQLVIWQGGLKADRCTRMQAIQVHGDRTVGRETEGVIAVAPVFDERDIREGLGGRCTHTGDDTITISRL